MMLNFFKKENFSLQQELQKKQKEIERLKLVICNLKVMPCLTDIVADLQEQVHLLKNGKMYSVSSTLTPSRPSSSTLTPSRPSSGASTPRSSSDYDVESEMASIS
ncbi:Hypothetical predicted protein [Paramuricea clavata]|uniref:Uncharacterized protein n=1 Tax=Paramuricea clavata TaxID=317549 RepID=A0A6S7JA56_PARCT|nr:Hypothetical predicted protein [Paramuricea clavata]